MQIMNYYSIVSLVKNYCIYIARQYSQDKDELFSYVLVKVPALVGRMDTRGYTTRQCVAYIKKSVRGYCLHYIRDEANLIKTPRDCKPFSSQTLLDTDYIPHNPTTSTSTIPWYISQIMADPSLGKRVSNAYLRYLDT